MVHIFAEWNGAMNESGALFFPDLQNVVDPETQIGWLLHCNVQFCTIFCMVLFLIYNREHLENA